MDTELHKRTVSVLLGAAFAVLIGLLALMSAQVGLRGRGSEADSSLAILNLLTGLFSLAGGIGYFMLRRWSLPVYGLSVVGHFISHGMLFASRFSAESLMVSRSLPLLVVPLVSLVLWITMMRQGKRGLLR